MVGTAVYQVGSKTSSHSKKRKALKSPGQAMAPPADRGASSPAMSPWMWKRGITNRQRSSEVRASDSAMLAAERARLAWVRGTVFGRAVVPEVWRTRATSSGAGEGPGAGVRGAPLSVRVRSRPSPCRWRAADAGQGGDLLRVGGGHDDLHAQLLEGEGQLLLAVTGVEGSGGSGGGGGETGGGHAGAVGEDESDTVAGRDTGAAKLAGERVDSRTQVGERGIAAAHTLDGDCLGGAGGEQLGDRRRRGHASRPPPRGATRCRGRRGGRACAAALRGCPPGRCRPRGGG